MLALAAEREAVWTRLGQAHFLTPNEKRAELGFEPVDGGDELVAPVPLGLSSEVFARPFDQTADGREDRSVSLARSGQKSENASWTTKAIRSDEIDEEFGNPTIKIWDSRSDGLTRESHREADGQVRFLDEPFSVGEASLAEPRDPDGPPEEVFNCRCKIRLAKFQDLDDTEKAQLEKPIIVAQRGTRRRPNRQFTPAERLDRALWHNALREIRRHDPNHPVLSGITTAHFVPTREQLREAMAVAKVYREFNFSGHGQGRQRERQVPLSSVNEAIRVGFARPGNMPNTTKFQLPSYLSSTGRGVEVVANSKTRRIITVIDMGSQFFPRVPDAIR